MSDTYSQHLTDRARDLRASSTSAESALWLQLRHNRVGGLRFRRQQPIGPFIVDFYCAAAKVAVELDGSSHDNSEPYDIERQKYLEGQGIAVLRFSNQEVKRDLESVVSSIIGYCENRLDASPRA